MSRTNPPEPLLPQPGSPIDPRNAVGRAATTRQAREQLGRGNNLGLNDPRRMGKTVWLDLFCSDPGDGFLAVKVDYEGVQTTEEFLLRTVDALRSQRTVAQRATARLASLFDGFDVAVGVPVASLSIKKGVSTRTPTDLLEQSMRNVDDQLADDVLLVIAMDEVPLAISNIADNEGANGANRLLQTLRSLRRRSSRLRWIVCGSVGFHHVLRACGATEGVVNDLVNLPLGPLGDAEARQLAERLFQGIEREADEPAVTAMVERSGGIPFLIHALAHQLHEAGSGPVSASDVDSAFVDYIEDRDESRAATHLVTRLDPLYGPSAGAAESLLDRVAVAGSLSLAEVEVEPNIVDDLLDDHYLLERGGAVRWRYDVLRRIWVHRRRLR